MQKAQNFKEIRGKNSNVIVQDDSQYIQEARGATKHFESNTMIPLHSLVAGAQLKKLSVSPFLERCET